MKHIKYVSNNMIKQYMNIKVHDDNQPSNISKRTQPFVINKYGIIAFIFGDLTTIITIYIYNYQSW